jgi:hypothetical protein
VRRIEQLGCVTGGAHDGVHLPPQRTDAGSDVPSVTLDLDPSLTLLLDHRTSMAGLTLERSHRDGAQRRQVVLESIRHVHLVYWLLNWLSCSPTAGGVEACGLGMASFFCGLAGWWLSVCL